MNFFEKEGNFSFKNKPGESISPVENADEARIHAKAKNA